MRLKWWKKTHARMVEDAAKERRLQQAETEVEDLKDRADKAIKILSDRNRRNHWSESINELIQGRGV